MEYQPIEHWWKLDLGRKKDPSGIEAYLCRLARRVLRGDVESTKEFDQVCRYVPPEMKGRVDELISGVPEKEGENSEK